MGTDTGIVMRAYLVLGIATLIASALMAAHVVVSAPASNYEVTILTNAFGEGNFEAAMIIIMLPAWLLLFRRMVTAV